MHSRPSEATPAGAIPSEERIRQVDALPDMWSGDFSDPALLAVALAAFLSGCVRGFAGFGTAMVYLPVAGQVLSPFAALVTLSLIDLVGPAPNVPAAWRASDPRDLSRLVTGLALFMPLGIWTLTVVPPETFRWAVSAIALALVALLVAGVRYRGAMTSPLLLGTGSISGFLGGVAGMPGPPVILLYMASLRPAVTIRANTLVYLTATDVVMLPLLALFGRLSADAVLLGLLLVVPSLAGNLTGARLFRPDRQRLYRAVAYALICISALTGLPIWG